ncbi:hypothetical protein M422DRAFT_276899 [Sphaerobolus stellatus SS14]|uniref:Unplaced genomic scaffold SPHSTscaffold_970, whole genome shotgun sequence n=1 Tax=Sphaerobolus stellatus (strain SS14) TaxID=990650 RepID=A0A0C9T1H9_SPHS4|nr:hypothetical protein M422DRAFT_276899 [Sphaerobolus stellatus SS14]
MYSRSTLYTPLSSRHNATKFTRSLSRVAPHGIEHIEAGALEQGIRENLTEYVLVMAGWGKVYHLQHVEFRGDEECRLPKLVEWEYPKHSVNIPQSPVVKIHRPGVSTGKGVQWRSRLGLSRSIQVASQLGIGVKGVTRMGVVEGGEDDGDSAGS